MPQAKEDAETLAKEIGGDVLLMDITKEDAVKTIQDYVLKNYTQLDILVNNAGITRDKKKKKMNIEKVLIFDIGSNMKIGIGGDEKPRHHLK